jgi:hypothetical protein
MKRIGEEISEKLDYTPGTFTYNAMFGANGSVISVKP